MIRTKRALLSLIVLTATAAVMPAAQKKGFFEAKKNLEKALKLSYSSKAKEKTNALRLLNTALRHPALRDKLNTLNCKADIYVDCSHVVPLMIACDSCWTDGIIALASAGARFDLAEKEAGRTPLHTFAEAYKDKVSRLSEEDIVRITKCIQEQQEEFKFSVDMHDDYGWTPFMLACFNENIAAATILNEFDTNPNQLNEHGRTCLHDAVIGENYELVKILLSNKNIDLDVIDDQGDSVYKYAEDKKNTVLMSMLQLPCPVAEAASSGQSVDETLPEECKSSAQEYKNIEDVSKENSKNQSDDETCSEKYKWSDQASEIIESVFERRLKGQPTHEIFSEEFEWDAETLQIVERFTEEHAQCKTFACELCASDPLDWTPLFHAVALCNVKKVERCLLQGNNPFACDATGETPLAMLERTMNTPPLTHEYMTPKEQADLQATRKEIRCMLLNAMENYRKKIYADDLGDIASSSK